MKIKMEAELGNYPTKYMGNPHRLWEKMELIHKDVRLAEFEIAKMEKGGEIDIGKLNLTEGVSEFKLIFTMRRENTV